MVCDDVLEQRYIHEEGGPNLSFPGTLWSMCSLVSLPEQKAQLSPTDRAMRLVSSNLANYHATVQKLLIRQVLTKPMV